MCNASAAMASRVRCPMTRHPTPRADDDEPAPGEAAMISETVDKLPRGLIRAEREGQAGSDQLVHPRLIIGPLTVTPLLDSSI